MKTIDSTFSAKTESYLQNRGIRPQDVLYFDIETTGLSPERAFVYLIGCAFFQNGCWTIRQFFAAAPEEEEALLKDFLSFSSSYAHLIHYNGQTFDIPFLKSRCRRYRLTGFDPTAQTDLYKRILPYKNALCLPGCRQKQLEEYLGICRKDLYDGGQLIERYFEYVKTGSPEIERILLLHNREDLSGLVRLTALFSLPALFEEGAFTISQMQETQTELTFRLILQQPLAAPLSCHTGPFFLAGRQEIALLRVLLRQDTLKLFFSDYKNYCYLPQEDQALHKSVAIYVDKSRRMPATADTCYTRRQGTFLPAGAKKLPGLSLFRETRKDRQGWILLENGALSDPALQRSYVCSVLSLLKKGH